MIRINPAVTPKTPAFAELRAGAKIFLEKALPDPFATNPELKMFLAGGVPKEKVENISLIG